MEDEEIKAVLDGGSIDDIRKAGDGPIGTVKNPRFVVQYIFDDEPDGRFYGGLSFAEDILDYGVHQIQGVTLSEKEEYYSLHKVEVDLYTLKDGELNISRYEATPNGWQKTAE